MTDSSTPEIRSPTRTRTSRRSRSRQKRQALSSTNGRISHPIESTASPNKPQIQRVYTTDCAVRPVGSTAMARENRLNAMRRRKSLPVQLQMPSSYFDSLQFDDDDDDDDDEDGGKVTNQRSSTWAQRKSALRKRSKSPLSPKNPSSPKSATRSRRSSSRSNNSDDQSQCDSLPQRCRWTNETNQKEKETSQEDSCRWQSSPSRRRSSSSSPLPPLRGVRGRGDRMVNPAAQTASSPRLPKRKVSHSNDDPARPTLPSPFSQTHMGPPSLETKGDCGNALETLKMQVMQTHDTKSYWPQRNHAETA